MMTMRMMKPFRFLPMMVLLSWCLSSIHVVVVAMETSSSSPSYVPSSVAVWGSEPTQADRCGDSHRNDNTTKAVLYAIDYACGNNYLPPQAWQRGANDAPYEAVFDLSIVGAGIGAAALVDRAVGDGSRDKPPIVPNNAAVALFEKTNEIGGRLQSAFGTGGLGMTVTPFSPELSWIPPMEYGGMRVNPFVHKRLFNLIKKRALYHGEVCTADADNATVDCVSSLLPMEVGNIRYRTLRPASEVGDWLESSRINTSSALYEANDCTNQACGISNYGIDAIANREGSPYDTCVQLVVGLRYYYSTVNTTDVPDLWIDAMSRLDKSNCGTSDADFAAFDDKVGMPGWCRLVTMFPDPATAIISCSGYDMDVETVTYKGSFLIDQVVNANDASKLFLLKNGGMQRLAQSLLFENGQVQVAPLVSKDLVAIEVEGRDTTALAANAAREALNVIAGGTEANNNDNNASTTTEDDRESPMLRLTFADGSSVLTKRAYLTMLPSDMTQVRGLESWVPVVRDSLTPSMAVKVALFWPKGTDIASLLGLTPCVPGPCQRIILDGPSRSAAGDPWMVRQVWLWDANSILLYQLAPMSNMSLPAHQIAKFANERGMGETVRIILTQLREGTGKNLPDPSAARLKTWAAGSLLIDSPLEEPQWERVSDAMRRPLGRGIGLYYGNSEMSSNLEMHGWVEGALDVLEKNVEEMQLAA